MQNTLWMYAVAFTLTFTVCCFYPRLLQLQTLFIILRNTSNIFDFHHIYTEVHICIIYGLCSMNVVKACLPCFTKCLKQIISMNVSYFHKPNTHFQSASFSRDSFSKCLFSCINIINRLTMCLCQFLAEIIWLAWMEFSVFVRWVTFKKFLRREKSINGPKKIWSCMI